MREQRDNRAMDGVTLEESLKAVLTHRPDPAFVAGLEQELLAKQSSMGAEQAQHRASPLKRWRALWAGLPSPAPRLRWAAVPLIILGILFLSLLAVGPEQAWAALQEWLGYVPNVGFVELEESRLLAHAPAVTHGKRTLQVTEVVASAEETAVVLQFEGGTEEAEGALFMGRAEAHLRLPDGQNLQLSSWRARGNRATLFFPALPSDRYRATLEIATAPGAAVALWRIPLSLQADAGAAPDEAYPLVYRPVAAQARQQGITLEVVEVAHTGSETAVQIALTWADPAWDNRLGPGAMTLPYLRDGAGNHYRLTPGALTGAEAGRVAEPAAADATGTPSNRWVGSRVFEPVPATVQELTLVVADVEFEVPADDRFTVDLGDSPQIGDRWPLDVTLDVAGFPVQITGAELRRDEINPGRTVLHFDVAPVPEQEDRRLVRMGLAAREAGFGGAQSEYTAAINKLRMGVTVAEGAALPTGPVDIDVRSADISIEGPWQVTWPVPGH